MVLTPVLPHTLPTSQPGSGTAGSRSVRTYVMETYLSRTGVAELGVAVMQLRAAAAECTRAGTSVRYLLSLFIPEDEMCLHLVEAPSMEAIEDVARRAALTHDRIAEALVQPLAQRGQT